ncbi:hypothetical protein GBA52_019889 [Prunus armeniaca]|nr:hypothetical protein GBA52_019889 [Prunus armeniaca]
MSSATNLIFGSPWRGNFEAGRLLIALAFKESSNLVALHDHCATFLSQFPSFVVRALNDFSFPCCRSKQFQCVSNIDYKSIFDIGFGKTFHGSIQIINRDNLNVSCNVVLDCKINHLLCFLHTSNPTPSYNLPACNCTMCKG